MEVEKQKAIADFQTNFKKKFVDFCCNEYGSKNLPSKRYFTFSLYYTHYNYNRKSKLLNFDGKSGICKQISKRNLSISVSMSIVAKISRAFCSAEFQPRKGILPFRYTILIIKYITLKAIKNMKIDLKSKTQLILLILIALTLAFIFGQSMLPAEKSMETSDSVAQTVDKILDTATENSNADSDSEAEQNPIITFVKKYLRKIAHFVEHGVLGFEIFLLIMAMEKQSGIERKFAPISPKRLLFSINIGVLVAFADESIQIFSGRMAKVSDMWIDIAGYAAFSLLAFAFFALLKKLKTH